MTILLIGAGYIGMHLLQMWPFPEDTFTVLTTSPHKVESLLAQPKVSRVVVDDMEEAIKGCQGVIVCVAPKAGAGYEETYLSVACRLAQLPPPEFILYTSSTSVYGDQGGADVDEQAPLNGSSPQAEVLKQAEQMYLSIPSRVTILRLAGIYGPGRELEARAERLSGREMPGSGAWPTNHSHRDDIARALAFCYQYKLAGIYNVVGESHPTREELYGRLCKTPPTWRADLPSIHGSNCRISSRKLRDAGFRFLHEQVLSPQ